MVGRERDKALVWLREEGASGCAFQGRSESELKGTLLAGPGCIISSWIPQAVIKGGGLEVFV